MNAELGILQRHDDAVASFTQHGDSTLAARSLLLTETHGGGRSAEMQALILFDPVSGLFLCVNQELSPEQPRWPNRTLDWLRRRQNLVVYTGDDRIALFSARLSLLSVRQSQSKAANMEEAEAKSLDVIKARLGQPRDPFQHTTFYRAHPNNDYTGVPRDFLLPPRSGMPVALVIRGVARIVDGWEVTIQGRWIEKVRVGDDTRFLGHSQIVDPPPSLAK